MHSSLISLKSTQAETFAILPKPKPRPLEESKYLNAHSLDDLSELDALEVDKPLNVPEFTLLRCAIEGCGEKKPTSQQLFELLEARFEWLKTEKGRLYEVCAGIKADWVGKVINLSLGVSLEHIGEFSTF